MARYAFKLFNGITSDVRFVADDYVLQVNEVEGFGDTLPSATPLPGLDPNTATVYTDADYLDMVSKLKKATATQIKNYVQNNVTDLASAKILLTKILLVLARTI